MANLSFIRGHTFRSLAFVQLPIGFQDTHGVKILKKMREKKTGRIER